MVFDCRGALRGDDGAEVAQVSEVADPGFARVSVGPNTYEVSRPGALGWHFQLLDGGSRVLYDFRPGLRRGGTIRSEQGEGVAKLAKNWTGRGWRIALADGIAIDVRRRSGVAGPALAGGSLVAPELNLTMSGIDLGTHDLWPLLAFSCWLISQWESERPGRPVG
jgi:hypothetical protein